MTKVQIQKTIKNYEIQKKPQITAKNTNLQIQTKRKYESSKIPQTTSKTTKTTNIVQTQTQSTKRKYELTKIPQNTSKTTNIQIQTTSKRKYESTKKPETITKTTNVKVQNNSSKYSLHKKQESATKSAYQAKKTAKKY